MTTEEIILDAGGSNKERGPVVVNAESGSNVVVNVDVKNFSYPEWLDEEVRKHFKWEGGE